MGLRFSVAALASTWLLGCAAAGSNDTASGVLVGDGGAAGPEGSVSEDASGATGATGPTGPTGSTGPGVFDSGPPAVIGGDDSGAAPPADSGPGLGAGCTTLAQCPYATATNVSGVACLSDGGCSITCNGDNYDVNGALTDGCEVPATCEASQSTPKCPANFDNHTKANAANAGSYPCDDGSSGQNMTGAVPSDYRAHLPAVDNFDAVTGSAPGYFSILASGGTLCQNDANLNLTITGARDPSCYVLTMLTDKNGATGQTCTASASGTCSITNGSGSYSDGSMIYVWVSKSETCLAASTPDTGVFSITGHL